MEQINKRKSKRKKKRKEEYLTPCWSTWLVIQPCGCCSKSLALRSTQRTVLRSLSRDLEQMQELTAIMTWGSIGAGWLGGRSNIGGPRRPVLLEVGR